MNYFQAVQRFNGIIHEVAFAEIAECSRLDAVVVGLYTLVDIRFAVAFPLPQWFVGFQVVREQFD